MNDQARNAPGKVTVVTWICALSPLIAFVLFGSLALHAWLVTDLHGLGAVRDAAVVLHWLVCFGWLWLAGSLLPLLWFSLSVVRCKDADARRVFARQVPWWIGGLALFAVFARWNPGNFWDWFFTL